MVNMAEDFICSIVDRILPLKEGKAAYGLMERGEMFGKIVLTP